MSEPVVISKIKIADLLKKLEHKNTKKDKHRPRNVHHFSKKKESVTKELMETILNQKFNTKTERYRCFLM